MAVGDLQQGDDGPPIHLERNLPIPFLQVPSQVGKKDLRSFLQKLIIPEVFKSQGENAKITQIGLMDAGETFYDFGPNPQEAGPQRGMFPAGTLSIIFTADDYPISFFPTFLGKIGVDR